MQSLDLVLPISTATLGACVARGLPPARGRVVPLGIRLDRFATADDKRAARTRMLQTFGIDGDPALMLCSVGRLVPRKGVEWLVSRVMPQLPRDVVLLVVGEGPDRRKIERAIEANGLKNQVHLLGAVSDSQLEIVYQGSDLFMMPNIPVSSDMEGFGLVMLEAGLLGLPVIAADIEGISDVIAPGENGELVESGNAGAFRDAVMSYYVDRDRLRAASVKARLHVVSRFGWSGVIQRYLDELKGILKA
jgi:phosphatidylinositol alpha-1,6-mannosyltransferase